MSVRIYIFLPLSLFLTVHADADLHVTTRLQCNLNDDDSVTVTVICQYDGDTNWTMGAQLLSQNKKICETSGRSECAWSKRGNQLEFTLKNRTSDQKEQLYKCHVYRRYPLPIIKGNGEEFKLYPGFCCPALNSSCDNQDHGNACPPAGFLNLPGLLIWALIVLVLLLCLYSLSVTILYIKLRVRWSEELHDTLTYVPMQVKPKKKVRRHEADKNTEYMDMREVHPQAGFIRDLNHNSHHAGFALQSNISFNRVGM